MKMKTVLIMMAAIGVFFLALNMAGCATTLPQIVERQAVAPLSSNSLEKHVYVTNTLSRDLSVDIRCDANSPVTLHLVPNETRFIAILVGKQYAQSAACTANYVVERVQQ